MSNLKDWADVEPKYKWRAFDEDGELYYYTNEPTECIDRWVLVDFTKHEALFAGQGDKRKDWQLTLEQRPE